MDCDNRYRTTYEIQLASYLENERAKKEICPPVVIPPKEEPQYLYRPISERGTRPSKTGYLKLQGRAIVHRYDTNYEKQFPPGGYSTYTPPPPPVLHLPVYRNPVVVRHRRRAKPPPPPTLLPPAITVDDDFKSAISVAQENFYTPKEYSFSPKKAKSVCEVIDPHIPPVVQRRLRGLPSEARAPESDSPHSYSKPPTKKAVKKMCLFCCF
eukprot:Platyproteum_vivax@DN14830_c0_g1_i1.p1